MELQMKKRIVGVILLIAMGLIIIPMFFGRSVKVDELTLSGHVPHPPALPAGINAPIPPQSATVPAIAQQATAPAPSDATAGGIVFEQLESLPLDTTRAEHPEAAAVPVSVPVTTNVSSVPAAPVAANPEEELSVSPEVAVVPGPEKEAKPMVKAKKAKPVGVVATADRNTKEANSRAAPEAWAVQLGSFSDKINASNLMKRLQDAGFSAYMHDSKTAQGNLIRVLVGPQLHRSDANKIQKQLQQQFSLKSIVVKVTP